MLNRDRPAAANSGDLTTCDISESQMTVELAVNYFDTDGQICPKYLESLLPANLLVASRQLGCMIHCMNKQQQTDQQTVRQENDSLMDQWLIQTQLNLPIDTNGMIAIVELCGYRFSRSQLNNYFTAKQLVKPRKHNGKLPWHREQILDVMDLCERDRRWRFDTSRHEHKYTDSERIAAAQQRQASEAEMAGWIQLDEQQLLMLLVDEDRRQARQTIVGIMLTRFQAFDEMQQQQFEQQ